MDNNRSGTQDKGNWKRKYGADNQNWNNGAANQNAEVKKQKQNPPKHRPIKQAGKTNPILHGKQGFSITYNPKEYNQINPSQSFGAEVVDILNQYADKVFRSESKSCYFTQKLTDLPPVFIETDIPDPSIIVDAIFEDLLLPCEERQVVDSEKTVCWSNFYPVQKTCLYEPEVMLKAAKDVLRPVFIEQPLPQHLSYKIIFKCKIIGKVAIKSMEEELDKFLSSSRIKPCLPNMEPDVKLVLCVMGNCCLISLLTQGKRFGDYNVSKMNRQNHTTEVPVKQVKQEETPEQKLENLKLKLYRAQSEKNKEKLKKRIELLEAEIASGPDGGWRYI